eukprot:1161902-Pelagomonas_calceolata.AAC.15
MGSQANLHCRAMKLVTGTCPWPVHQDMGNQANLHCRAMKLVTGPSLACERRYGEPSKSALSSNETCHRRVSLACEQRHRTKQGHPLKRWTPGTTHKEAKVKIQLSSEDRWTQDHAR